MSPRIPKPDGKRVCANCKRRVEPGEMEQGRAVCSDRAACRAAVAELLSREQFAQGVSLKP